MGEPVVAVARTDDASSTLRGARASAAAGAWRHGPDALLDQRPARLDRIEVVGVRRQRSAAWRRPAQSASRTARALCAARLSSTTMSPRRRRGTRRRRTHATKPRRVHGAPAVASVSQPSIAHRADHRQVVAPVHRPRFDQLGPARQPRVRAAHREIRARFIEKHEAARIYRRRPRPERGAFGLDARHDRVPPAAFVFFEDISESAAGPARCWTDGPAPPGAALPVVRARQFVGRPVGLLLDQRAAATATSTGEVQPPALANGVDDAGGALPPDPALERGAPTSKRAATSRTSRCRPRTRARHAPQFGRIRIRHARNRSQNRSSTQVSCGVNWQRRCISTVFRARPGT